MTIGGAVDPIVVSLAHRGAKCATRDGARCPDGGGVRAHHDRLLQVEDDPDELVNLLELAVTWQELDYGEAALVPPAAWIAFAEIHWWRHPDRMRRLFSLAADVALRAPAPPPPATGPRLRRYLAATDLLAGDLCAPDR